MSKLPKEMKALVYHGPNDIRMETVPTPKIKDPTDAIIRVTLSTICGTDIHIKSGGLPAVKPGTILGHEFCGEIVEVGSGVHNFKAGDKVAVNCVTHCGNCFYCLRGIFSQCIKGSWIFGYQIDGCQAEYNRIPHADSGLELIPEGLREEDVLFIGDILSTGLFGVENAEIEPGSTVAVFGCGPVGMCAMTCARLYGPSKIIAVDLNEHRLEVAKQQGIADVTLNPLKVNAVNEIKNLTGGRGAGATIEAVGITPTFQASIDAVRPGGIVSIIGVFEQPQELKMHELWIKNITIKMGLVNANHLPRLTDLIKAGKIDMNFLQTHRSPLNDIIKGYEVFEGQKDNVLKWVVTPYEYK